jgi:hypothetical protein
MITSIKAMQVLIASTAAAFIIFPEAKNNPGLSLEGSGVITVGSSENSAYGLDTSIKGPTLTQFLGVRPAISFTLLSTETYLLGLGIDKTVSINNLDITLSFYPSYSHIGEKDKNIANGSLNFKTTLDVSYAINNVLKLGLGMAHISNGGIKKPNKGLNFIKILAIIDF